MLFITLCPFPAILGW